MPACSAREIAIGSAGSSLTALTLARRTANAMVSRSFQPQPGFHRIGNGSLAGWQMAGSGGFIELGANIIELLENDFSLLASVRAVLRQLRVAADGAGTWAADRPK